MPQSISVQYSSWLYNRAETYSLFKRIRRIPHVYTHCFDITPGQINRDFGNTLENCLEPITRPRNFCNPRTLRNRNAPNSFVRYRTITGICNNLLPGRATVGAGGTVTPRFFKREIRLFSSAIVFV